MSFFKRQNSGFSGAVLFLAALAFAVPASANCGLDYCPRDMGAAASSNHLSLNLRQYAFDLRDGSGDYQEAGLHYEYTGISFGNRGFALGASLPFELLEVHGASTAGISNPLISATYYHHFSAMQMFYLGVQLELPWGDSHDGLAADHFMVVPYAQWEGSFAWGKTLASVGLSNAFGGHEADSGAEEPLYVHPHEDRELLYRVAYSPWLHGESFRPRVFVSGQYALVDELEHGPGRSHVSAGLSAEVPLGPRWSVEPLIEFPLETPARFDWSAGASIRTDL